MGYMPNALINIWNSIVAPFSSTKTYSKNDYCRYDGKFYKAKEDIAAGAWNATKWEETSIADNLGPGDVFSSSIANSWDPSRSYEVGSVMIKDGIMYTPRNNGTSPTWIETEWVPMSIYDFIDDKINALCKALGVELTARSVTTWDDGKRHINYDSDLSEV